MVATIDRLTSVPNGEVFGYPPVQGHVAYMAQSFKAVGSSVTSIEFLIAQGQDVSLATYDERMLKAARAMKLPVAAL